jgi:arylsulfatase A-like enzyme
LIISYPKEIKGKGGIRAQYGHVIDILPTTLELLGSKAPERIRGIQQQPIEGTSLAYSFTAPKAPSRHTVQHYYIFGSRAIYKDGWKAALPYPNKLFNSGGNAKPFDENAWELYNLNDDYTERLNLAAKYPEKVTELRALFEQQARDHNLYPLITWDDVLGGKIHRTKDSMSFSDGVQKITGHPAKN